MTHFTEGDSAWGCQRCGRLQLGKDPAGKACGACGHVQEPPIGGPSYEITDVDHAAKSVTLRESTPKRKRKGFWK